jgi:hypothetical protein
MTTDAGLPQPIPEATLMHAAIFNVVPPLARLLANERSRQMQSVIKNHEEGQRALQNLYQSIESNLALAKHAAMWERKEVKAFDIH